MKKYDLVTIGGGACGLAAALTVAAEGGSVLVLDKADALGGMTKYAEGMFAVGTKYQREMKLPYKVEDRFRAHMQEAKWQANPRLVRAFMEKTADTLDWLEDMGCEFTGVVAFYPGAPFVWHTIKGRPEGKHGSDAPAKYGILRNFYKKMEEYDNLEVMLNAKVTEILREENGPVTGVRVTTGDGEEIVVEASCVLCATGGYGNDKQFMKDYCKNGENIVIMFDEEQTGDSIKMAWAIGAEKEGMGVHQTFTLVDRENITTMLQQIAGQPNLWVNKLGERYCDESIVNEFPSAINALVKQPEATAYSIIDSNMINYLETEGLQYTLGEYFTPGSILTGVQAELERGVSEGKVLAGDSIEELAAKIGCDPAVFAETVEEYNACCRKNDDFIMAKDRQYLHEISGPKYYAVEIRACLGITEGGIKVNHKMEVIDTEYKVIPGLYAGGCAAGGMIGDSYIMITSGGSLSFALNSGRITGENVLKYVGRA